MSGKHRKHTSQVIRIMLRSTFNKINRGACEDYNLLTKDDFLLEIRENCSLGPDNFRGSGADAKLNNMFFGGATLQITFWVDHATITPKGTMDCRIGEEELEEDVPFRLNTVRYRSLFVDDVEYVIAYLGIAQKFRDF